MLATSHHRPRRPVHHHGGRLLGHRRRLRPRRQDRRPLVRLDGRLPDGAQGDLGLAPQAAPGRRPHHQRARTAWRSRAATSGARFPYETIGTWTTKIARLPVSGGWHALVYTKTAEYGFEKDSFLLLAQSEEEAPALHHRFLDKRSPLPLHGSWADWLWQRGLDEGEIVPLQSVGVSAYRCSPKAGKLREDLSAAVASGWLTLPREEEDRWIGR